MRDQNEKIPFGVEFWQEEGGDQWVRHIEQLERSLKPYNDKLLESIHIKDDGVVLDIGCGGGLTSYALSKLIGDGGKVVGVDVSRQILQVAQSRFGDVKHLEFKCVDAGSGELGVDQYDTIISRFGVMFFERPVDAFTCLNRCLKTGGIMAFICWRELAKNPWMYEPARAVEEIIQAQKPTDSKPDPDAPNPFSLGAPERIRFLLSQSGFSDIQIEPVEYGINLGSMSEALSFLSEMGPAAAKLLDATDPQRAAGVSAMKKALGQYQTPAGIITPSAGWLVTAVKTTS